MGSILAFSVILSIVTYSVATDDFYDNALLAKRGNIGYTDFNPEEADAIVARHNYHRSNTNPPAANMIELKWDNELATKAQSWADTCNFKVEISITTSQFSRVGQNVGMGTSEEFSNGARVTDLWHSEEDNYNYDSSTCYDGKICGHYTQVIWADTTAVGCGRKLCSSLDVEGRLVRNAYIVVCDYGPTGNYFQQRPFIKGGRSSKCPDDAAFSTGNGLCRDCSSASDKATCGECLRTCEHCGTVDEETCMCKCAPGWYGPTCTDKCEDQHSVCGLGLQICAVWRQAGQYCKKTCGDCEPEDPSFVCNE